ncbi:MAG: WecB/TagA/CpsF family glycosyltransferase [Merismopedia sp. SIO2A8]|nr:WecB/TagA/CpsF family glycosyltransferase [Merismopedia sp. SIO2A8]
MTHSFADRVNLLNITLDNLSMGQLLPQLSQQGGMVVTPNVDHLVKLQSDPEFHQVYRHADYVVCDSKILMHAAQFLGQPLREKISGSDLFPAFYTYYANDPAIRIFLLGGPPGVAQQAQARINAKVGRSMVVGTYCPPFGFEHDSTENDHIVELINASQATVLAVGVGAPKQEKWIYHHRDRLPHVNIFLAIGATLNFEAGYTARSPAWISDMGLEWLYRLISEPRRLWKRYLLDDVPFAWFILQQFLNRYHYRLPLGQLLQEAGLLTAQQVRMILAAQAQSRAYRFGELAVQRGWLQSETVNFFADQYPQLALSSHNQPLGQYLKSAALIDDQQIRTILTEQDLYGGRFGEIAVGKGWVPKQTIDLLVNPRG